MSGHGLGSVSALGGFGQQDLGEALPVEFSVLRPQRVAEALDGRRAVMHENFGEVRELGSDQELRVSA